MGLRPLANWDCGFESRRGHGYLSFVCVVFCQVEVSVTDRSFIQRSPNEFRVSECDLERPVGLSNHEKEIFLGATKLRISKNEKASQEGL